MQTGMTIFRLTFWWVVPVKAELGSCETEGTGNPVDEMLGGVVVEVVVAVEVTVMIQLLPAGPLGGHSRGRTKGGNERLQHF